MLTARDLRHGCDFASPQKVPDGAGGFAVTWSGFSTYGALAEDGRPIEGELAGGRQARVRAILTVRDDPTTRAVGAESRVTIDGEVWNVRGRYPFDSVDGFLRFSIESGVRT